MTAPSTRRPATEAGPGIGAERRLVMVRVEVKCSRCDSNVLVLLVAADPRGEHGEADQADLTRRIAAHGWTNTGNGPACTECTTKPAQLPTPAPVPAKKRRRKEVLGEAIPD